MQYRTAIPFTPPIDPGMRQSALAALSAEAPGVDADVYGGLAQRNAVQYDRAAQKQNDDYTARARGIQSQMAMRGLQQLAQQQENQMNIANTVFRQNLGRAGGMLNSVLGGLYQ
jgi:hypothetical protein